MADSDEDLEKHFLCWALTGTMAETGDAAKFAFGRKLNEYIRDLGLSAKDERAALTKIFILSSVANTESVIKNQKKAAYKIVSLLVESSHSKLLSGANTFDNVAWFNKEVSDESLNIITTLLLLASEKDDVDEVLKLYKTLTAAKLKAAYKCELFLKPFAPVEKKTPAKKDGKTGKAKSSSKTSTKKSEKSDKSEKSGKKGNKAGKSKSKK